MSVVRVMGTEASYVKFGLDPQEDALRGGASGRTGEGDHLGLGLYVVRLIVEFHQGQVRAFNHPRGGKVVFEITLPPAD